MHMDKSIGIYAANFIKELTDGTVYKNLGIDITKTEYIPLQFLNPWLFIRNGQINTDYNTYPLIKESGFYNSMTFLSSDLFVSYNENGNFKSSYVIQSYVVKTICEKMFEMYQLSKTRFIADDMPEHKRTEIMYFYFISLFNKDIIFDEIKDKIGLFTSAPHVRRNLGYHYYANYIVEDKFHKYFEELLFCKYTVPTFETIDGLEKEVIKLL